VITSVCFGLNFAVYIDDIVLIILLDNHFSSHVSFCCLHSCHFRNLSLLCLLLLPSEMLLVSSRKFCSLPQVIFEEKVLWYSCSQSFWWQMFRCSWTTYLEQLTCQSVRQGSHCTEFRRQLKTWCFRRTSVHREFLIIAPYKYSYLLTYLLTYLLPLLAVCLCMLLARRESTVIAVCLWL